MTEPKNDRPSGHKPGYGRMRPEDLTDPPEIIRRNWGWMLALGVVLIIGGLAAFLLPFLASVAVTGAIGAVFLIGGALQFVHGFRVSGWRAQAWSALSAAVYLAGGVLLLLDPLTGMVALSVLVAAVFLVDGVVRIVMGLRLRPERGWGWVLAGGIASALFAGVVLAFLPGASMTLLGIMAAVLLTLEGWGCIFLALAARRAGRDGG